MSNENSLKIAGELLCFASISLFIYATLSMDLRLWLFFAFLLGLGIILWEIGAKKGKKENKTDF